MRRAQEWTSVLVAAALLLSACGSGEPAENAAVTGETPEGEAPDCTAGSPAPSTTATSASDRPASTGPATTMAATSTSTSQHSSSTTSEPSTTTVPTTAASAPATTDPRDPELEANQQALTALGYWLGEVDGVPGSRTRHAVTAFQKAEGLPRTAALDETTIDRLAVAVRPTGRSSTGLVLEIDLARQILLIVDSGQVLRVYDVATGAMATPTPPGEFRIYNEIDGFRHAPLGTLYRPKYFNGGIAFHGYTSVPSEPASHGCVRLTYSAMDDLWASGNAAIGTLTWVY